MVFYFQKIKIISFLRLIHISKLPIDTKLQVIMLFQSDYNIKNNIILQDHY